MLYEITMAGFGGQGIMYLGDLVAEAALREGREATFLPTYGVAMRGGTANCIVTISDEEIGCPLLNHPNVGILMNQLSLLKYQPTVRPGGLIIANATLIERDAFTRQGEVRILWIPATETARTVLRAERSANIVVLGAFLAAEPVVKIATIEGIFRELSGSKKAVVEQNLAALHAGVDLVKTQLS